MELSHAFHAGAGNEKSLTEAHDLIYLDNRLFKAGGGASVETISAYHHPPLLHVWGRQRLR
jgi:hypothetical protein